MPSASPPSKPRTLSQDAPKSEIITSSAVRYEQDFDGFPNGTNGSGLFDGSDFHSSANKPSITNDELVLTLDGDFGTATSFRIPGITGSSSGWTATFDVILSDTPGDNLPADGFSFSYGAIPAFNPGQVDQAASDANGQAEEGWGILNHISFEVDTWENNPAAPEAGFSIGANQDGADLVITEIDVNRTTNAVLLSWSSIPAKTYAVDVSTTLEEGDPLNGNWGEINGNVASGGNLTTFTDNNNPNGAAKRFYRVREVTAP